MNNNANPSIKCSVSTCAHHCTGRDYCSLDEIKVGCCDPSVTNCGSTECASFELSAHGQCCR